MARGSARWVGWTLAALGACGVGVAAERWLDPCTAAHRELLALAAGTRPITPWWSGARRAAAGPVAGRIDPARAHELVGRIEDEARDRPNAARLHALGMSCLLRGVPGPERLQRAVVALTQAVDLAPERAALWNDLATALFVRARVSQQPEDLLAGLAAAERAVARDPGFAPARFNRALALEVLSLFPEARLAWRELLAQNPDEPWRGEAVAHLRHLSAPRIDPPPPERPRLPEDVAARLAEARRLEGERRMDDADAVLDELNRHLGPAPDPFVAARVLGRMAGLATSRRRFDRALTLYAQAQEAYRRAGLPDEAIHLGIYLAEAASLVHEPRLTWDALAAAWSAAPGWRDPVRLEALYAQTAESARRFGLGEVAGIFQRRAVEMAIAAEDPGALAEAVTGRGGPAPLSPAERAEKVWTLEEARHLWLQIGDAGRRRQALTELRLAEARLAGPDEEDAALRGLTGALADLEKADLQALLPEALLARAALFERRGRRAEAAADLSRAVEVVERGSRNIAAEGTRSAYAEAARPAFEANVRFSLQAGDHEGAFAFAERAHQQEFLTPQGETARPVVPTPQELAGRLRPGEAAIVYFALPDRLLIWAVRPGRSVFLERPIGAARLGHQVDRFREALSQSRSEELRQIWSDHLLGSLWSLPDGFLAGVERIWVVPDGPLYRLPFGALGEGRQRRLLLASYEWAKAPTASALLGAAAAFENGWKLAGRRDLRLCAVGNPAFDSERFPTLSPLPAAEEEARQAAAAFPGSLLLTGADATRARVLGLLDTCDLFHFAGHSIPNAQNPERSQLVLAPAASQDPGVLYGRDIEALTLTTPRLAVLSACSTAAGSPTFFGLARPFLAAGVPTVIGSLWDVGDAPTTQFFSTFYRTLEKGGTDPITALNQAQREALTGPKPGSPAIWAAFEVYFAPAGRP